MSGSEIFIVLWAVASILVVGGWNVVKLVVVRAGRPASKEPAAVPLVATPSSSAIARHRMKRVLKPDIVA